MPNYAPGRGPHTLTCRTHSGRCAESGGPQTRGRGLPCGILSGQFHQRPRAPAGSSTKRPRRGRPSIWLQASAGSSLERIISLGWLGNGAGSKPGRCQRARLEGGRDPWFGSGPADSPAGSRWSLGSGSAFFEIVRYLAERQPVILAPRWMQGAHPADLHQKRRSSTLMGCLEKEETTGRTFDIGGPEVLTFERLMEIYAEIAGLRKRLVFSAPFISPGSKRPLDSPGHPDSRRAWQSRLRKASQTALSAERTGLRLLSRRNFSTAGKAIRRASTRHIHHRVEACWTDAGALVPPEWTYCGDEQYAGGTVFECGYRIRLKASAEEIWEQIVRIGGIDRLVLWRVLWQIRGWLDKLFGGTSLHRGRRHPYDLHIGDALDFWRVLDLSPPFRLLLLSEMKMPGEAILEFKITPIRGGNRTPATVAFSAQGLSGAALLVLPLSCPPMALPRHAAGYRPRCPQAGVKGARSGLRLKFSPRAKSDIFDELCPIERLCSGYPDNMCMRHVPYDGPCQIFSDVAQMAPVICE